MASGLGRRSEPGECAHSLPYRLSNMDFAVHAGAVHREVKPLPQRVRQRSRRIRKGKMSGGNQNVKGSTKQQDTSDNDDLRVVSQGNSQPIVIDGSFMEGGGQVLRISLSLAAITGKSIQIVKIRQGRSTPGLREQHLWATRLIRDITSGSLSQCRVGTEQFVFMPGVCTEKRDVGKNTPTNTKQNRQNKRRKRSDFYAPLAGAGSITLLSQVAIPALLYCKLNSQKISARLCGGTCVAYSPPLDHLEYVMIPLLSTHFGVDISLSVVKRGFFPRGGGDVRLSVKPCQELQPLQMVDRGNIVQVRAILRSFGYATSSTNVDEMSHFVRKRLCNKKSGLNLADSAVEIITFSHFPAIDRARVEKKGTSEEASSSAQTKQDTNKRKNKSHRKNRKSATTFSIQLVATTTTGCVLSANAASQRVGTERETVTQALLELEALVMSGSCVDEHTQDQLIVFMALAAMQQGALIQELRCTTPKNSKHADTAMHFASLLTGTKFDVEDDNDSGLRTIRCTM